MTSRGFVLHSFSNDKFIRKIEHRRQLLLGLLVVVVVVRVMMAVDKGSWAGT